jgi:hypothetical protein
MHQAGHLAVVDEQRAVTIPFHVIASVLPSGIAEVTVAAIGRTRVSTSETARPITNSIHGQLEREPARGFVSSERLTIVFVT